MRRGSSSSSTVWPLEACMAEFGAGLRLAISHVVVVHGWDPGEASRYFQGRQVLHLIAGHGLGRRRAVQLVAAAAELAGFVVGEDG